MSIILNAVVVSSRGIASCNRRWKFAVARVLVVNKYVLLFIT